MLSIHGMEKKNKKFKISGKMQMGKRESWRRMEFNKVTFGAKGKHERKLFGFFSSHSIPRHSLLLRKFYLHNAFWLVSLEIDTFSHENLLILSMSDEKYLFENFLASASFHHCALPRPSIDVQSQKFTTLDTMTWAETCRNYSRKNHYIHLTPPVNIRTHMSL